MGAMLVRHEPASAAAVRRELALDLDPHGVHRTSIDDVTLVASELVGNAVRHAGARRQRLVDRRLERRRPTTVVISVEDPSTRLPVLRAPGPGAPNGRGLAIVEALSPDWGVERLTAAASGSGRSVRSPTPRQPLRQR